MLVKRVRFNFYPRLSVRKCKVKRAAAAEPRTWRSYLKVVHRSTACEKATLGAANYRPGYFKEIESRQYQLAGCLRPIFARQAAEAPISIELTLWQSVSAKPSKTLPPRREVKQKDQQTAPGGLLSYSLARAALEEEQPQRSNSRFLVGN
jgi:hypothetical protein